MQVQSTADMKANSRKLLAVSAIYFSLSPAFAADATGTCTGATINTSVAATAPEPANRIASRFESLAGSPESAASLVAGLRSGTVITLGTNDSTSDISFTPATPLMGYAHIKRALSLAQRKLAAQGIAEPTPEQVRIALNGGMLPGVGGGDATRSVEVEVDGVLQLRSQGMGWGRIAHQLHVSPGNRPPQASTGATSAAA